MSSTSDAHTLLTALTGLPARTRETLSHLEINRTTGTATCVPDPDHGGPITGPITRDVPLAEQLRTLERTGLWGHLTWDDNDSAVVRVQLWAQPAEREAWRRRILLAGRSAAALAALTAGGDVKLASWRRDAAMAALRVKVRDGDDEGIGRTDLIALTQVARSTVYSFFKDDQAPTIGDDHRDISWAQTPAAATVEVPRAPQSDDGPSSAAAAPAASRRQPVDELVRMPTGHFADCVVCSTPATTTYNGRPVHPAECLRLHQEAAHDDVQPNTSDADVAAQQPPEAAVQVESVAPASPAAGSRATPARAGRGRQARQISREKRFTALAGALDADYLYLPGRQVVPWEARHIGDIAMLVDEHRLGHGGGATLPERGEIWLYPSALERLGLPDTVEIDKMALAPERAEQTRTLFRELNSLPAVADALDDGWELAQDRMDQRTRISHPHRLRAGAHLVAPSWSDLDYPLFLDDDGDFVPPEILVDRVQAFADHVGVAFRITPAITGLDLIDHTRPPRRSDLDDAGRAVSVVMNQRPELPPFLEDRTDSRVAQIERNFSWWREWDSLSTDEASRTYVHAYDHKSHFLNPWSSADLGVQDLVHLEGGAAAWDGSEKAAYYLVSPWETPDWALPDPANAVFGHADGKIWVTPHTLKQLEKITPGFTNTLTFHEAWTWDVRARYLAGAGKILASARADAPAPIADTVKEIYAATTNKLASRDARPTYHLRRPDWRDMVIAASRTAIVATLITARDRTGVTPLVVDRDTIIYASNDPDPRAAWPGDPAKLDAAAGGWRPTYTARLAEWGPNALAKRAGAWRYTEHINAMTEVR